MSHTCEDCGEEFETLSSLRLHDCPDEEPTSDEQLFEEERAEIERQQRKTRREVKQNVSDELTDAIDQAQLGVEKRDQPRAKKSVTDVAVEHHHRSNLRT